MSWVGSGHKPKWAEAGATVITLLLLASAGTAHASAGTQLREPKLLRSGDTRPGETTPTAGREFTAHQVIVRYRSGTGGPERAAIRERADATLKRPLELSQTQLVRVEAGTVNAAVREFEDDPDVRYAEPNFIYEATASPPNDTRFGELWGLENTGQTVNGTAGTAGVDINALDAWDTTRGNGTVIAILDTGVADDHPDLVPNLWANPGETSGDTTDDDENGFIDDVGGYDFVDDDSDPDDLNGHGTHVAGTAGAQDDNALGVSGVAPDTGIMAVRVLDDSGSGTNADVSDGIVYAAENGADVVNLSLAGAGFSNTMSGALNVAKAEDALAVAAAGNGEPDGVGDDNDAAPQYPCSYLHSNLICVAAIDQDGSLTSFSNFGATSVDVGAPGTNILSSTADFEAVFSEDFETPLAGRWETGGTNNSWARTTARSVSPSNAIEDSPSGDYLHDTDSFIRNAAGNTIDLSGAQGCTLEYELDHDEAFSDSLDVEVQGTGGSEAVGSWTGNTPFSDEFIHRMHDISGFDGDSSVRVEFRQISGDFFTPDDGAYIDDVVVTCHTGYGATSYEFLDGTSMAAPHVSGVAALVRVAEPAASAAQVANAIRDGAVPEPSLAGKTSSGGRVDAAAAFEAVDTTPEPVGLADSPWPMFHHDPQHTGRSPYEGPHELAIDWQFDVEGTPGSPAIGEDGTIYLPTGQPNQDTQGFLYAINPDGTLRWRYEFVPQPGDPAGQVPVPGFTTPAVAADGTIYVHTNAGSADGEGFVAAGPSHLFAVNPDGTKQWAHTFNDGSAVFTGSGLSSPAIAPDGTIYVGSKDTGLYAIHPDGTTKWVVVPNATSISSSPAIGADGTVYVNNGDLYAYDPDGDPLWNAEVGGSLPREGSPAVAADGTIYACTATTPDACHAVSDDGAVQWDFPMAGAADWTPALSSSGTAHATGQGAGLYAIDSDGAEAWHFDTGSVFNNPDGSPVLGSDGVVYARARGGGGIFVLNPNGTQSDSVSFSGNVGSDELSPAIGSNGTLYVPQAGDLAAYVEQPPDPPTITDTDPDSPANDNSPEVKGTAAVSTTVTLYESSDCSGPAEAQGSASEFASPGLTASVAGDQSHQFAATATDGAQTSACSSPLSYTEDSSAPAAPQITDTGPDSPANDNDPEVKGTTGAGSPTEVKLYENNASCTGSPDATGTVAAFTGAGITVNVAGDATTALRARATDAAGNDSGCSSPFDYTEDSVSPNTTIDSGPSGTTTDSTPSFAFSSNEANSSFQCRVDSGPFAVCASPRTSGVLTDGPHTFAARAVDQADNVDQTPASRSFTVDAISSPPANPEPPSGDDGDEDCALAQDAVKRAKKKLKKADGRGAKKRAKKKLKKAKERMQAACG